VDFIHTKNVVLLKSLGGGGALDIRQSHPKNNKQNVSQEKSSFPKQQERNNE